jgi:hypothetical protein
LDAKTFGSENFRQEILRRISEMISRNQLFSQETVFIRAIYCAMTIRLALFSSVTNANIFSGLRILPALIGKLDHIQNFQKHRL